MEEEVAEEGVTSAAAAEATAMEVDLADTKDSIQTTVPPVSIEEITEMTLKLMAVSSRVDDMPEVTAI